MPTTDPSTQPTASLLRHRDFVTLWVGQSISEVGSQVSIIAIPLTAVIALHATPFQVGLLGTFQFLPFLLIGLPAGVWVDRSRRRRILIVADCGRAVAVASIPLAASLNALTMAQLYAVGGITGVLSVFFDVAYQSLLPALVSHQQLVDGNAKLETTRAGAEIAGPGLGGVLIGWLGAPVAVLADAISYVGSVVFLLAIRTVEVAPARVPDRSLRAELAEGFSYVVRHPILRLIAACTGTSNLFAHAGMSVLLLYAVRDIGLTPLQIGLWFGIGSMGAPIGALLSARMARRLGIGPSLVLTIAVASACWLIIPLAPRSFALPLFILSGVIGSLTVGYNILQVSLRQAITPPRLLGRMNATMRFLVWGTIPVGAFAGGVMGSTIGLHATLWVTSIGGLLAIIPVALPPVRRCRTTPDVIPEDEREARLESAQSASP